MPTFPARGRERTERRIQELVVGGRRLCAALRGEAVEAEPYERQIEVSDASPLVALEVQDIALDDRVLSKTTGAAEDAAVLPWYELVRRKLACDDEAGEEGSQEEPPWDRLATKDRLASSSESTEASNVVSSTRLS